MNNNPFRNAFDLLAFMLLLCLPLSFQGGADIQEPQGGVSQTPAEEPKIFKPGPLSPYLIEWYLDISDDADLRQIWRQLKIEAPDDRPYRCGGDCATETFNVGVGGEGEGDTVALKISVEGRGFYQYLIFRKARAGPDGKEEWVFLGNIDSRGQGDGPPEYRVEAGSGRTWFVVRELWRREPEAMARREVWHEIKEGGIKQVLSYPFDGYDRACGDLPRRSHKAMILHHGTEDGEYTVPVQFLVSYDISDCRQRDDSRSLFAKGQKARYVWDAGRERFVLDASRSDITEEELGRVYGPEALSGERFIEYNFEALSNVATSGNLKQKEWLSKFLTGAGEGPRKSALLQRLKP